MIGLLVVMSGVFVKEALASFCLLAMVLLIPQFVHGPFPVPVSGVLASVASCKNHPPQWQGRE